MPSALLTKLKALQISEVSGVDDPANELPGWVVLKARGKRTDVLRKAAGLTTADALAIIVDRAAERAVAKAKLAEIFGTAVPLTEVEQLSAALVLKAKHSTRHPQTGQFIATGSKPTYTPGPDADQYDGAPTNGIEPGTGNPAPEPARPSPWVHLGATLFTGV